MASNAVARSLYARWGLKDEVMIMTGPVADLEAKIGAQDASSFGSIHLQSDNLSAVEQAVRQFVPRLPGGSRGSSSPLRATAGSPSTTTSATATRTCCDGWPASSRIAWAVTCLLGIEREELVRIILFERGRILDQYLSVPEFYGPLPPGDVVGLAANPTVVTRLTGADPAAIRQIARTAPAPADLPPAPELLDALATALGIEGAPHGWANAPEFEGAIPVERA